MTDDDRDSLVASRLEALRESGQLVARGRFRLDPAGAAARAANLLDTPDAWLLPLLSHAVANGASLLELNEGRWGIEARFDGSGASDRDLQQIAEGIPTGSGHDAARLRELAWALHVARASGANEVSFTSATGATLVLEGDRAKVDRNPSGVGYNTLAVTHATRARAAFALVGGHTPPTKILRQRGRFAPPQLNLRLGNARLNPPLDLGSCAAHCVIEGPGFEDLVELVRPRSFASRRSVSTFSAVVGIGGRWYRRGWWSNLGSVVAFVQDGVSVLVDDLDLVADDLRAVVWASQVRFDASRAHVVRDAAFDAVVRDLRDAARSLLHQFADSWTPGSGDGPLGGYTQSLESLESWERKAGTLAMSVRIYRLLAQAFDARLTPRDAYAGDPTRRLASALARSDDVAEARSLLERLARLREREWRNVSGSALAADLASLELDAGQFEAAEARASEAYATASGRYEPKTESVERLIHILSLRAEARRAAGGDAHDDVGRALRLIQRNPPRTEDAMLAVAALLLAAGMPGQASEWGARIIEHVERWDGTQLEACVPAHALIAFNDLLRGEGAACRAGLERGRATLSRSFGSEHPEGVGLALIAALAHEADGDPVEADAQLERAEATSARSFGPSHSETARIRELRAAFDLRRGHHHRAADRLAACFADADRDRALLELEAHVRLLAGSGEAATLLERALEDDLGFPPRGCLLTLSYGALWTAYDLPGLCQRPLRWRLHPATPGELARSARELAPELERLGHGAAARRALDRARHLEQLPAPDAWPGPAGQRP